MISFGLMIIFMVIELATKQDLWVVLLSIAILWVGNLMELLFNAIQKMAEGVVKAADEISKTE